MSTREYIVAIYFGLSFFPSFILLTPSGFFLANFFLFCRPRLFDTPPHSSEKSILVGLVVAKKTKQIKKPFPS